VWTAALTIAGCSSAAKQKDEQLESSLRAAIRSAARPPYVTKDAEGTRLWKHTRQFYEKRNYNAAWIEHAEPRAQMADLSKALWAAGNEGLDPQLYSVSLIDERRVVASKGFLTKKGFEPGEAGALDVMMTYLYMKYASDLADGISDLAHADPKWRIKPVKFDPLAHLETALTENRVAESLLDLIADDPQYTALRHALHEHREVAAQGGWPQVPANARLKPGQTTPAVPAIAKRLAASGDSRGASPASGGQAVYDTELQEAVKRFQRRHGLEPDAVVGPALIAEMNVSADARVRQLELNLERWRWLPRSLGDPHVLVNLPEYRLEVWERGRVPLTMRVVVGKQDTPTPIFNDDMTHIVFSPYWNVPPGIAEGETLPSIMKDPSFLDRNNMEVLDRSGNVVSPASIDVNNPTAYRFRQRPGASNSLGLVKFMFPNQYDVYLHDTPADSLFARASRSFSHGCVRVEQPQALAEYLLRDDKQWTPERIQEAMHAGEEKHVKLAKSIPVYLGYWTARVSADGIVQFRKDVYGIDQRQMTLLAERLSRQRAGAAAARAALAASEEKIAAQR
jgi:murein L,D-transpeptidase YcbB/YkuD